MNTLTFAITGANGQIGSHLTHYIRQHGHTVFELVRSQEKAKEKSHFRYFNLFEPNNMPGLSDVDVLIHCAHYFDTTDKSYLSKNLISAKNLIHTAMRQKVKRVIFISSISAFEDAQSLYGKTKFRIEKCLSEINPNIIIIRPGLVFHEPLQGITAAMDGFIKKCSIVPLISGGTHHLYPCKLNELSPFIYKIAITNEIKFKNPVYAASPQHIIFKDIVRYLAKKQHKKVLFFSVPYVIVYWALKIGEQARIPIGLRSDSLVGLKYINKNITFEHLAECGNPFTALN